MKLKAIFFDLDGTLLPMDQNEFIKAYLGGLVTTLAPCGYEHTRHDEERRHKDERAGVLGQLLRHTR